MFAFSNGPKKKNTEHYGTVKRFEREIEPHEVFLDHLAQKKEEEWGTEERRIEAPLSQKIMQALYLVFLLVILVFVGKTLQFQILEGALFSVKAEENRIRVHHIVPERGVVYDRTLQQMVLNEPSFDLVFDKRDFTFNTQAGKRIVDLVSEVIGRDPAEVRALINSSDAPRILITGNLDHDTLVLLEAQLAGFAGFHIEENTVRQYLEGPTFSHILGYTGKISQQEIQQYATYSLTDAIGKQGIEKQYEDVLRGTPGEFHIIKNAVGEVVQEVKVADPVAGDSVVLWLDSALQGKITEALLNGFARSGAKTGAAVALDPKTGGVLALVSLPGFDNNQFSHGMSNSEFDQIQNDPLKPLFNRAVSGLYPTGSTIKPFIAAAALQENIITDYKQILSPGFIEIQDRYNPEKIWTFLDWKVHGWADMRKAIADSVNVYFYAVGGGYEDQEGLGPSRIKSYLSLFGWGQETHIDLPGEAGGLIPDPAWKKAVKNEGWWDGNTYNLSIGQGDLLITPLQVAVSFVPIANQGILLQPHIVKAVIDQNRNTIQEIKPNIIRQDFIDEENLQVVREGMRQAVTRGSSVSLSDLQVAVAAKTGTAQTPREGYFHNWVTVFAPYENPEIVLTIMVESVKEAQVVALPIVKEVLEWYFSPRP